MHLDVVELKEFYASPLGHVVRRLLGSRLRARWSNLGGYDLYGLGYAAPYLGVFKDEASLLAALMPAEQGVVAWPSPGPRRSVLVDEAGLPLLDGAADRLLLVHLLEGSEDLRSLLREVWRVLAPNGRVLVIVPNRRGLWARVETTPFGSGRPFSRSQLSGLLREASFVPEYWQHALYMPPFNYRFLLKWALFWERLGLVMWPTFSGVIMVEASKQVYGALPIEAKRKRSGRFAPVPAGVVAPFRRDQISE